MSDKLDWREQALEYDVRFADHDPLCRDHGHEGECGGEDTEFTLDDALALRGLKRTPGNRFVSVDRTHGRVGHVCSTLCGAGMLRALDECDDCGLDNGQHDQNVEH